MDVPNHADIPQKLFDTGVFNLKTHEGQGAYVDACVAALHGRDPNWRHLKKKPGQTAIHRHGEDSAVYLLPNNKARAVDFIAGAGGPNPGPGWLLDPEIRYTHADAHDPDDHGIGAAPAPQPIPQFPYPDENGPGKVFQSRVKAAYGEVNRPFPDPNDPDAFRHFMRYGYSSHEMPEPQAADKHIAELRDDLSRPRG